MCCVLCVHVSFDKSTGTAKYRKKKQIRNETNTESHKKINSSKLFTPFQCLNPMITYIILIHYSQSCASCFFLFRSFFVIDLQRISFTSLAVNKLFKILLIKCNLCAFILISHSHSLHCSSFIPFQVSFFFFKTMQWCHRFCYYYRRLFSTVSIS